VESSSPPSVVTSHDQAALPFFYFFSLNFGFFVVRFLIFFLLAIVINCQPALMALMGFW